MVTNPYTQGNVRFLVNLAPDRREPLAHMVVREAVQEVVRALNTLAYEVDDSDMSDDEVDFLYEAHISEEYARTGGV